MYPTPHDDAFTDGDRTSRFLLDLTADRAQTLFRPPGAGTIELAQRHGLVALLAEKSDDLVVRAILARETARQAVLRMHLRRILTRLHDSGVMTAVLKGPAMASFYRNPAHRPFADLDILVPERQAELALSVLAADQATVRVPAKRPKADKREVLFSDESGIRFNVDLHWNLYSYTQFGGPTEGATERAWAEAVESIASPLGPTWDIPDSYRTALLAAHAVLDHRFRMILFRDFLELTRVGVDWEELGKVTTKWNLRSTTYVALWMSKVVLGAPIPDGFLASLHPRSMPIRYLERALPRVDIVRFDGHKPHPVNLAAVLLNDSPRASLSLLLRAPFAVPGWRRRVASSQPLGSSSPRTLILASTDKRRGAEVFSERLQEGLLRRGWVVEAVSLRESGDTPTVDLEPLVRSSERQARRLDLGVARALRRKIRFFAPDVVLANGGATLRYAAMARMSRRFHLVYVAIGEPTFWLRSRLSRWLNRQMLRRVDLVLAVSEVTRLQLEALEPSLRGRTVTAYQGVPQTMFVESASSPEDTTLNVVMVGSLTAEKDPMRALRVVAAVPNARLRLVGDGPLLDELEAQAEELGITGRVAFAGSVLDIRPHLDWAHVLILTSLSEGLPGAILEAGAAGVPTVTVDVGGVSEAIEHGVTGLVTASSDQALIMALQALDSDRESLAAMASAVRTHIQSKFEMGAVVDRYAELLEKADR